MSCICALVGGGFQVLGPSGFLFRLSGKPYSDMASTFLTCAR